MKKFFTILVLSMAAEMALAEDVNAVVLHRNGQTDVTYAFTEDLQFVYGGKSISLECGGEGKLEIPVSEKFYVDYTTVAIEPGTVTALENGMRVLVAGSTIEISTDANMPVVVYNVEGAPVFATTSDACGLALVKMANLPKGVNIIQVKGVSFKFIK